MIREHAAGAVEAGLGYGISALFACEDLLTVGGPEMRHVVIDPHQDTRFAALGPQALGEAGVAGLVEFHSEQSQIVLPLLLARGRRFDMAAIATTGRFCAPALAPTPGRSTTWWRQARSWYPMSLPGPAAALLPMRAARLFVSGPPRRQDGQPEGGWTAEVVGGQMSGPGASTGSGHWFLRRVRTCTPSRFALRRATRPGTRALFPGGLSPGSC